MQATRFPIQATHILRTGTPMSYSIAESVECPGFVFFDKEFTAA
jgi:hypothetical protein